MKSIKMEESLKDIIKNIDQLGKHVLAYDEHMGKLGKQLSTTVTTYNTASREFKKIDKDIFKITDGRSGGGIEVLSLEKPFEEQD